MFGLGYIVQNVSTTLSGLGFVPMKSESGNAFDLSYIPVSKIKTDEKNFQNRADKYSAKSVEAIIKAVKNGNFNWFAFDPVLLWENENGDLIVLSGHSRTEAFRRLSAENPDLEIDGLSFKKIPAKIFKGSFANAKNLALNSNALSTPETLIERAEFYRKQRKKLSSNADIKALRDKALRENQGSVIWDLSYLPENGLALDSLKRFKLQEDSESAFENFIRAVNIAQWIGKAFQIYKGLSSAHDAELFKFLLKNYGNKSGQYNSFSKLNERLSVLYPRNVKDDKKINEKGEYQNAFGLAIFEKNDDEISELENLKTDSDKAKRELQNKIKDLRGRTTDKAKIFEVVTPYFNEYINNLFQYWQELDRERLRIVDKNQGALFGCLSQMIDGYSVNDNDVLCAGLGKPTVKFEFEDNADLFNFFMSKKSNFENAQNVDFKDITQSPTKSKSKRTNLRQTAITTPETLYLPYSERAKALPGSSSPKSLPPTSQNIPPLTSILKPDGVFINHRKIGDYGYINDNLKYINFYIDKEYMVNDNIFKWSERIFPHAVIIICFQDSNGIWKFFFQRPKYKDFIFKKFPNSFIQNSGIKYFIFDLQHIEKVIQAFESEGYPVVLIHRNVVDDINDIPQPSRQKALPPSGLENDETFIPFGYQKITDEKVIQRFNESRNILNNSGLILVSDIISVIEKKPSVIFTTAGTDGIKKYKFKGKEDNLFVFEAVNDNGEKIPGEVNIKYSTYGIERLNALKSWFIAPETDKKTSVQSPNFNDYERRFANASGWASFDPERSAKVNVSGYKDLYDYYVAQVDNTKIDAFNKFFDSYVNNLISARSKTANWAVTGGGGISASKARKLNAASDRYMEMSANFKEALEDFVKKLNRSARRAEFVQMTNEERSDERFNELKKGIDYIVASRDLLNKMKKDKSIIPTVKRYETYLRIYGTPEMAESETLRMTQYNYTLDKSGLYDKILREYNNGNNLTVNRVLDYLKDKDIFTEKHKVWNLRKKIENQPDFVSVDNSKKIFEGAEILENRELDRVQIKFDGIPSEDCRNDLKSNGFRWSPYYKVWQRKLTPQAVSMAYRIVEKYYNQISLGKPTIKFEFENNDEVFKMFETPGLSGNVFAVFNCPISDLKCLGFSPTYKKLSSYDSLVDTPQGGKTLMGYGFENATLTELNNACKYYKQVEKLAQHLKGDSTLQSAFNVWYFLHENIIYNYDTEGQEEIRTPARSWADRLTGIDCDCLAVLTACLLFNMGYKPKFEFVGFNNNNCYSHIFVNLDGLAIDRVLPTFLKRPDGITNTKIMEIPVFELNGGDELINDCLLNGIYQSTLKKVANNANSNDIINLRKIELLNNLQNSDTNAFKFASILMPYVSLIDDDGNFYFTDSVIADSAELADDRLYELYTNGASDSEKENFLKQFVSAFREIQIEVEGGNKPFVNVKIQNVFSKPFTVEGNMIEKKLITLNPNFNRIKEAILFLLSVNYADLAKKIAVGLLPLDRVVNNGYNEEKWENAKIANAKLFEFWRLIGGDTALLIENIKDGYYNNLSGCKTLSGVDSIDETITTDIAVERVGNFLAVLLDWFKDVEPLNIIQNNDNHFVNSVSADSNSLEDNSLLTTKAFIAEQPKISVNNPGLWIVAAAALGLSAVALSKKK